jgi:serine/threonine protein kinase
MHSDLPDALLHCRPLRSNDPRELGAFTLIGRLGSGGQGVVYLGRAFTGDLVAVKLLAAHGDLDSQQAMAKELAAAQKVAAFCTARVLDTGLSGDDCYIVTEYVRGPTLLRAVQDGGVCAGDDLHRLAIGTATAVAAIHRAGIVHRDLKPGNVLLSPEGPRVIDFGISRAFDAGTGITSGVVGTPAYMAPEQLAGERAGPAADVFAWAGLIVFASTGRPPFGNDSIPAVINRIVNDEPDLTGVSGSLQELLAACLIKNPDERPSAHDVLLRLLDQAAVSTGAARGALETTEHDETVVLAEGANLAATTSFPEAVLLALAPPPAQESARSRRSRIPLVAVGTGIALLVSMAALAAALLHRTSGDAAAGNTTRQVSAATNNANPRAQGSSSPAQGTASRSPAQPTTPTQIADASLAAMTQQKTASFEHKREEPGDAQPTATGQFTFTGKGSTNYDMSIGCSAADTPERIELIGNTGYTFGSGGAFAFDASPGAVYTGAAGCALPWARDIRWGSSPYNVPTLLKAATDIRQSHSADTIIFRGTVPTSRLGTGNPSAPLFAYFSNSPTTHFTIELSGDYLPHRVELSFPLTFSTGGGQTALLTTTYDQWGLAPQVAPPR